jgi:glucosyl-dolichyl phosphate glucuronosyltransferase
MRKNELISVVICTYNRADLARQAIKSILAQDFPPSKFELLIVDNASTDHTHAVAQEFCSAYPNVRYFFESNIGLSNARNRGWQEAGGEYVAYIDDDCKVPPAWLSAASRVVEQVHPPAFGGPYFAFYNSPKPAWFKDEYGSHVQGHTARPLEAGEYLSGGNMFLCVDILRELGGFKAGFGMKGEEQAYGEETELFHRLRKAYPDSVIMYDPALYVYHLVRSEEMKLKNILRRNFNGGRDYAKINQQSPQPNNLRLSFQVMMVFLRIVKSTTWDLLLRDRSLYPFYQNSLYEVSFRLVANLGYCLGLLGKKNVV